MIQVDSLSKWYGPTLAVDAVSFEIPQGEIVGFLGPNGAGKSTTLRMVTGYLPPSRGRASVNGYDVMTAPREARLRMGYLPESTPLYDEMRVTEYLHYRGRLFDMPRKRRKQRIDAVIDRCGLEAYRRRTISRLSKGNRQRVGLAQSLLHEPPVLILDEPTAGLDPNQITAVRSLIDELKGDHTILLSTHILPEVEKTADRVVIISGGRLVADGPPAKLREQIAAHGPVVLEVKAEPAEVKSALSAMLGVKDVSAQRNPDGWTVARATPEPKADPLEAVGKLAVSKGWPLRGLYRETGSLEDFFTQVTTTKPAA
jgi:ABC-2 type transport system ATP-binding protein